MQVAVLPLSKNDQLIPTAREVLGLLQPHVMCDYDQTQAIGRRYRRQDEIGTPLCITVDFETLGEGGEELKDTVTIRHRDSMEQERLPIDSLLAWLLERVR